MPASKRLGVASRISIIIGHVASHDVGGVSRNIQSSLESVLQLHTNGVLSADSFPCLSVLGDSGIHVGNLLQVGGAWSSV